MKKKIFMSAVCCSLFMNLAIAGEESQQIFALLDTDKNKEISISEYRNGGMDSEGQNWSKGLSKDCTNKTLKLVEPELVESFAMLDTNKDKSVSQKEFTQNGDRLYDQYWKASFKVADQDNNKELSKLEYQQQAQKYLANLSKAYADKSIPTQCKDDVAYWKAYYQGLNKYIGTSFQYLDQNTDDSLTYVEYSGAHLWQ